MKKTLSFLAILVMAVCPQSLWADDVWNDVSTADKFALAVNWTDESGNHSANIRLTADIDISSLTATSDGYIFKFDGGFKGKIDGHGHALENSATPLFYHTENAEITNLIIDNFHVTNVTSPLARSSKNCSFSHVTVKNSTLKSTTGDKNYGMIAGYSESDKFEYCKIDSKCSIKVTYDNVGGVAGWSTGSTYTYCHNSGYIYTSGCMLGGIVGEAYIVTIDHCLNTGNIFGNSWMGGIAGIAHLKSIAYCVNTGYIGATNGYSAYRAGIVGAAYNASNETVANPVYIHHCMNFGNLEDAAYANSILGTLENTEQHDNYDYCKIDGKLHSNLPSGYTYSMMCSGEYAYNNDAWYQDVDNNTFATHMPVPIAEAGKPHRIILCDAAQTAKYSNIYTREATHTPVSDSWGLCKTRNSPSSLATMPQASVKWRMQNGECRMASIWRTAG